MCGCDRCLFVTWLCVVNAAETHAGWRPPSPVCEVMLLMLWLFAVVVYLVFLECDSIGTNAIRSRPAGSVSSASDRFFAAPHYGTWTRPHHLFARHTHRHHDITTRMGRRRRRRRQIRVRVWDCICLQRHREQDRWFVRTSQVDRNGGMGNVVVVFQLVSDFFAAIVLANEPTKHQTMYKHKFTITKC